MNDTYKAEVLRKIEFRPRLTAIFTSTCAIPERLYEYNPRMFICYNIVKEKFEAHSLDQFDSYACDLPYARLDARSLQYIWKNDIRMHGKRLFADLDENQRRMERRKKREFRNFIEDAGKETIGLFAKDAWTFAT